MPVERNGKPGSARGRLLDAANQLFYEEGVHTVGVDRVVERAGVAKATLYTLFGSKDGLVRAYLEARDEGSPKGCHHPLSAPNFLNDCQSHWSSGECR